MWLLGCNWTDLAYNQYMVWLMHYWSLYFLMQNTYSELCIYMRICTRMIKALLWGICYGNLLGLQQSRSSSCFRIFSISLSIFYIQGLTKEWSMEKVYRFLLYQINIHVHEGNNKNIDILSLCMQYIFINMSCFPCATELYNWTFWSQLIALGFGHHSST